MRGVGTEEKAKAAATRLVLQRMRSRQELTRRLLDAGHSMEHTEAAVEMLVRNGYLDDAAFARAFIMDKMNLRGQGEMRIRRDLSALGVSKADIAQGFALCEAQFEEEGEPRLLRELQNAVRAAERFLHRRPLADAANARRAADHLARRGYGFPVIKEALQLYRKNMSGDDDAHTQ